jgi:peptide/nickel transport system substrate-binding protein
MMIQWRPLTVIRAAAMAAAVSVALVACRPAQPAEAPATGAPPATAAATSLPPTQTAIAFDDPDPGTFIKLTGGEPITFDPALAYDASSGEIIQNVYEPLITFDQLDPEAFVPVLAETVPSVDNGLISADGLRYTFPIRSGVTFHDGGTLAAEDVAYSLRRVLLQSDPTGPAWLLIQPVLGYDSGDVTEAIAGGAYAGDVDGLRENATAEELQAACERVMAAVAVDGDAVTVTLPRPWAPFLATIALFPILDREWSAGQGTWDGRCETWLDHYAPGPGASPLTPVANGTGPYRLDRWTPGEEVTLSAFDGYWRTAADPLWDGGPSGRASIPAAIFRSVPEWGTRLAALQSGDADYVDVPFENRSQVEPLVGEWCDYTTGDCVPDADNPGGPLRGWDALPTVQRADIFMNFNVAPGSPYLGSGALDGNGIPPDFFSDVEARRAMAACFDYDTYIDDVQLGQGIRNNGPIIQGMLGYNPDGPMAEFDLEACEAHLAAAWGGVLPETGFRLPFVHTPAIPGGTEAAAILAAGLAAVNPAYELEVIELPPPAFFEALDAGQLPIFRSGWLEDIHDPHNWVAPYTIGSYGATQAMPDELQARFAELVAAGVATADPAAREAVYFELQQLFYDEMPAVILSQRPAFRVEPRWLEGFRYRIGMFADSPLLYTLSVTDQ